jgi:hypothetical protein
MGGPVHSRLGLLLGEMLVFDFMPVVGRMLDLVGHIRCYMGAFLLTMVLWWSELKAGGRSSNMDSQIRSMSVAVLCYQGIYVLLTIVFLKYIL